MTTETRTRYTPEDLLTMPDAHRFELVDGDLVERHMSSESSAIAFTLNGLVGAWGAGKGFGMQSDGGLQVFDWDPGRVRFPDGAFVLKGRGVFPGRGHLRVAPDFVFDVTSPGDIFADVQEKVQEYLRAGIRLVWVVVPETRWVHVFRQDGTAALIREEGSLDGEDVLPGFHCPVADLFAAVVAPAEGAPGA